MSKWTEASVLGQEQALRGMLLYLVRAMAGVGMGVFSLREITVYVHSLDLI